MKNMYGAYAEVLISTTKEISEVHKIIKERLEIEI